MPRIRWILILALVAILFSCGKSKPGTNPGASATSGDSAAAGPGESSAGTAAAAPDVAALPAAAGANAPAVSPPAPVNPQIPPTVWHGNTNSGSRLFAYLYSEEATGGESHIRVLAASLLEPGSHHLDVSYVHDPHGPEENIQTADFADAADADGLRWSLQVDGVTQAHGKYPWKLHGDRSSVAGPDGELQPDQEAAVMAEVPAAGISTMPAAAESPDRVMLWMRIQSAPGWHGDAPYPAAIDSKLIRSDATYAREGAGQAMSLLEATVEHRMAVSPNTRYAVTVVGSLDLKQAAPLLEMLWADPAAQKNDLLRPELAIAAAKMGQPLDILLQAAHDTSNAGTQMEAAAGLARQGIPGAQEIMLDQARRDLTAGSRNFASNALILAKFASPAFRDDISELSGTVTDTYRTNQVGNLLAAIDANLQSVDELLGLAAANASDGTLKNEIVFRSLGERASLDDVATIERIPPVSRAEARSTIQGIVFNAKNSAVARIRQRFWRESDRPAAAARDIQVQGAPPRSRDVSLP